MARYVLPMNSRKIDMVGSQKYGRANKARDKQGSA
jgi:hypothetical protein